jgi:hypothetical protein
MCSFNKRNCIVDKSLKIINLIKNAVRLILDNFGIVGFLVFGRMPVDSPLFSPHFDSILSSNYFILKALGTVHYLYPGGGDSYVIYKNFLALLMS